MKILASRIHQACWQDSQRTLKDISPTADLLATAVVGVSLDKVSSRAGSRHEANPKPKDEVLRSPFHPVYRLDCPKIGG